MTSRTRAQGIIAILGCFGWMVGVGCTTLDDPAETRVWSSPERIHESGRIAELAVGDAGDAMVLWKQGDPDVFASGYSRRSHEWSPGEKINNTTGRVLDMLDLSMDAQSNAIAVWGEESAEHIVFSSRTDGEGMWKGPAIRIDGSTTEGAAPEGSGPRVSMNSSGTAFAIWIQSAGASQEVRANRYARAAGWEGPVRIDGDVLPASSPAIAVDPSGNAVAAWTAGEAPTFEVWSAHYALGEGWAAAEKIGREDSTDAAAPDVGIDAQGDAVVVWRQGGAVWSNRFSAGSWVGAVRIDARNGNDVGNPDVAVYPDGRAVAVWSETAGGRSEVWFSRFTRGGGWEPSAVLDMDDTSSATAPRVAASAGGTAVAVWMRSGTEGEVIEAAALIRGSWTEATPISPADQRATGDPRVATDPNGNAIALWTSSAGQAQGVWVSHWSE